MRLAFALLLALPSGLYLWRNSDLPQFCDFHDDCIYYVSAKSLAAGEGYRIESLPEAPAQTKHPPLYPLWLSLAWRVNSNFPENLRVAAWLSWLAFPVLLLALARYAPWMGCTGGRAWLLLGLVALNPYVVWFGSQLLSELLFMALAFGAMLLAERAAGAHAPRWLAPAAGAVAGLAYLARSAGIALLAAAFAYFWMQRERGKAWWFAGGMLPFVAAWAAWSRLNMFPASDPALLYYVDYAAYERLNVTPGDLHLFLWKNADGLLLGLGSLVLPKVTDSLFLKIVAQVIAVAMISGVVRLVRRGQARLYALFALASCALLLAWHFPPDERFVLPMFPLALAGLFVEMEHLGGMLRAGLRHRDVGQRAAAVVMGCAACAVFGGALALQWYVAAVLQPQRAEESRAERADQAAAYGWIRENTTASARVLAYADPRLYLYTGRKAVRRPLLPRLWYREDHAGVVSLWGDVGTFARAHGLRYYYFGAGDLSAASEADRLAIEKKHRHDSRMIPVFAQGSVKIYEFGGFGREGR